MTNKDYTHIALVVDRSGSMQGIHTDMNGAILKLLADQAEQPGQCLVDIMTFDTEFEHPYFGAKPEDVKGDIIVPRGSTALNDAIGNTIARLGERFSLLDENARPGTVIVVIVTDGMENASREYTTEQVKRMVDEQTEKWNWVFMYLAANVDAFETGAGYGMKANMSSGYVASRSGVTNSYLAASSNITRVRGGDFSGFTEEERDAANAN